MLNTETVGKALDRYPADSEVVGSIPTLGRIFKGNLERF